MIDFLSRNWFWILFLGSMILMHVGHGRHGIGHGGGQAGHPGHGGYGTGHGAGHGTGHAGDDPDGSVAGGRTSAEPLPSSGVPGPAGRDAG